MKKILGVLSLIAILTVAFSTKAIANDTDNVKTEFVADLGSPDYVYVAIEVPSFDGVFNVAVDTASNIDVGESLAEAVPIVAGNLNIATTTNDFDEPDLIPDLTSYVKDFNDKFGYDEPDLIRAIATNVGKLTKFTIRS